MPGGHCRDASIGTGHGLANQGESFRTADPPQDRHQHELCGRGSFAVLVQDRIGLPGVVGDAIAHGGDGAPGLVTLAGVLDLEQPVDQARDTLRPGHDDRVAIGRRHVTVVLIIVENPLRLAAARFVQALDEQVDGAFQDLANPADVAPAAVELAGVIRYPR